MSKIIIGNDHGAVELKESIVSYLSSKGHQVSDFGVADSQSADYPDKAREVCSEYLKGGYDFGILLCGTGIGISISANKIKGIRCAMPQNSFAAQMAKEHNNVNFIAFGGRIDYTDSVLDMLDSFMDHQFGGDRHQRRVDKIMSLEC